MDCVKCGGSGWVVKVSGAYEEAARCACRKKYDLECAWRGALPPERSEGMTLESFKAHNESQRMALRVASRFAEDPMASTKGVAFLGPVGSGKTHLLVAVARKIVSSGHSLSFVDFDRLASRVRAGYSDGVDDTAAIARAVSKDFIVIDELGKGRGTDWECWLADKIITHAYQRGTRLLVASNHGAPGGFAGSKYCPLEQRIGGRAWSRLQHMAMIVQMDGPDGREYHGGSA